MCEYCNHEHPPDPFYCIARLQEKAEALEAEMHKYKAFWEYSREADKQNFLHYEYGSEGKPTASITVEEKEEP